MLVANGEEVCSHWWGTSGIHILAPCPTDFSPYSCVGLFFSHSWSGHNVHYNFQSLANARNIVRLLMMMPAPYLRPYTAASGSELQIPRSPTLSSLSRQHQSFGEDETESRRVEQSR